MVDSRALLNRPKIGACPHCDLLLTASSPPPKQVVCCPRCCGVLREPHPNGTDVPLACYVAAAICQLLMNCFPIVIIQAVGQTEGATLIDAVVSLAGQGLVPAAFVVLLTTIFLPALEIFTSVWILLPGKAPRHSEVWRWCFRARRAVRPWSMLEIFMLGALVAIVKLGGLAGITLQPGAFFLLAFVLLTAAAERSFEPELLWLLRSRL